jgi:peptidoglycan/xylan/chitin deacetylase (PgdA/CDA1 family)
LTIYGIINMMKISVVVPARNEENYLGKCLQSLKDQTYTGEYEILLINNGSTDKTAQIARSFGIKVIDAFEQKSVFYARQVGVEAADGDIIVQADGDTLYPRRWLEKIAAKFESHPKAVALSGRFLYREKFTWAFVELNVRNWLNNISAALFGRPFLVCGATFAFRRKAFDAVGGYKDLPYSADQHGITTKLRKEGKILYDSKIYVLTSARSVAKPCFILLMAVVANLARLMLDFGINIITPKPHAPRMTLRRQLTLGLSAMLAFFIAFCSYGYFSPISPVFGKVYYQGSSTDKLIALTFDDGPNGIYTEQILDILNKYDVDATFFCIGQNVQLYPDIAKRILSEGSVIGNHSNTHDANHALTKQGEYDLVDAQQIIYSVTGVLPHLYRPPHGKKTPWELDCVKANNLIEVNWSVATNDQIGANADMTNAVNNFVTKIVNKATAGSIILLHDGYGTEHGNLHSDRSFTVQALPLIIEQLMAKGYRFVTVPALLGVPAYNEAG